MLQYKKNDASEGIDLNKTSASKECEFFTIGYLKMLDLSFKNISVIDVMIY